MEKSGEMIKRWIKCFFGVSILLVVIYYSFMVYETRGVMEEFREVINDTEGVYEAKSEKLLGFRPRENCKIVTVKRYFTWCWNGKGRIWLYRREKHTLSNGKTFEIPDNFSMNIEKTDGNWIVTRLNIVP